MKLLPSSLAARTVLLIIAVVAIAEFATFSLFFHNQRTAHMNQSVRLVSSQVRLLQDVLPGLDSAARRRLAAAGPDQDDLQLIPDGPPVPDKEPNFGFARRLAAGVSQQLGAPISLRHAGQGRFSALWVGFMAGGERWWLLLPPPRFEPQPLPPELWLGLAGALAVLVAIAVFFVRGIVGPLARLGEAVSATSDTSAGKVLPEGPKEVRRLAERHNAMLSRLAAADAERREMLAGLAHDLRAPLARLRVRLALLDDSSERAGLARDTDDMERIVSQCLAFLHSDENSERAATPLLIVHVNLQRLLDNLIDNALQYGAPHRDRLRRRIDAGRRRRRRSRSPCRFSGVPRRRDESGFIMIVRSNETGRRHEP